MHGVCLLLTLTRFQPGDRDARLIIQPFQRFLILWGEGKPLKTVRRNIDGSNHPVETGENEKQAKSRERRTPFPFTSSPLPLSYMRR